MAIADLMTLKRKTMSKINLVSSGTAWRCDSRSTRPKVYIRILKNQEHNWKKRLTKVLLHSESTSNDKSVHIFNVMTEEPK